MIKSVPNWRLQVGQTHLHTLASPTVALLDVEDIWAL